MPHRNSPRRGSLAFMPRKRARKIYPTPRFWPKSSEAKPLGFAGWKAGMTHIHYVDNNSKSPTFGRTIASAVTIIDAPALFVAAIRFYQKKATGFVTTGEQWAQTMPKNLMIKRKTMSAKGAAQEKADDVRLVVATQPALGGIDKQKPDLFEIAIGGKPDDKLKYALSMLGKTLDARDVFKQGEFVDVSGVTKGSGYMGPVKRFHIRVQTRKDKQMHRHVGSIGSTVPRKVDWRVPQAGQFGFFTRTEYAKRIIDMGDEVAKITPNGGFLRYGPVKSFVLVEGSVPGPAKRLIRLRKSARASKLTPVEVKYISTTSKQGR